MSLGCSALKTLSRTITSGPEMGEPVSGNPTLEVQSSKERAHGGAAAKCLWSWVGINSLYFRIVGVDHRTIWTPVRHRGELDCVNG